MPLIRLRRDRHLDLNSEAFPRAARSHRVALSSRTGLRNADTTRRRKRCLRARSSALDYHLSRAREAVALARPQQGSTSSAATPPRLKDGRFFYPYERYRQAAESTRDTLAPAEVSLFQVSRTSRWTYFTGPATRSRISTRSHTAMGFSAHRARSTAGRRCGDAAAHNRRGGAVSLPQTTSTWPRGSSGIATLGAERSAASRSRRRPRRLTTISFRPRPRASTTNSETSGRSQPHQTAKASSPATVWSWRPSADTRLPRVRFTSL